MKLVALLRTINEQKITEAFGGRPVGDPNSQDASGGPEYLTPGGQEGVPTDEPEKEFKPEDFETKISRRLHRKAMKGRDELFMDDLQDEGDGPLGTCTSSFDDEGFHCIQDDLPWGDVNDFARSEERSWDNEISQEEFTHPIPLSLQGHTLRFTRDPVDGIDFIYDTDNDVHYFFKMSMREVDHPEYMPDEGPARYDPAYDYPNVDQRQPGFNTGFPSP